MSQDLQLPGSLSIAFVRGNDYSSVLDFSIDTTGYTFEAEIFSLVNGEILAEPSVEVINAATGRYTLSVPHDVDPALPAGTLGLRIRWTAPGGSVRDVLSGICEVAR